MALLAIIVLAVVTVAAFGKSRRKVDAAKTRWAAIDAIPDFKASQRFWSRGSSTGIAVDESRKIVALLDGGVYRLIPYSDVVAVELFEDGESLTKTVRSSQLGGALIGGVLFGGLGAVVGGLSGKRESTRWVEQVDLRVVVNDVARPLHDLKFLAHKDSKRGRLYKEAIQTARNWNAILEIVIRTAVEEAQVFAEQARGFSVAATFAQTYSVVFAGIKINASKESVLNSLAQLFKATPDQLRARLEQSKPVFKRGLSVEQAEKYRQVLDQHGCIANIESEGAIDTQPAASAISFNASAPPQATATKWQSLPASKGAISPDRRRTHPLLKWVAMPLAGFIFIVLLFGALGPKAPSALPVTTSVTANPPASIPSATRVDNAKELLAAWNAPHGARPTDDSLSAIVDGLRAMNSSDPLAPEASRIAADIDLKWAGSLLSEWEANSSKPSSNPISLYDVRHHITSIQPDSPDYSAAQKLLAREQKDEAQEAKANEGEQHAAMLADRKALDENVAARIAFAKTLEGRLLEEGMSVDLAAVGPKATTLRYKYALVSKSFAYKVQNDTDFLQNCRTLGFKKVEFTDGYDETWIWDLTKN